MLLWTVYVIFLLVWFVGVVTSYTMGGFIHFFLALAVIALIVQVTSGRRKVL